VYVIDDDSAVLESTVFLLAALGFEPRPFADARAFLAALAELPPACILTDLRMPGMDGWELAAELRARKPGWPMLLMTSDTEPGLAEKARELGFAALLHKPLDAALLAAALERTFANLPA
jgi:two-component system response regulator FixJ